jgi:hypothetical protein
MSIMDDILAAGLSSLATIKGEDLSWRAGESGSWTDLTGFCLEVDRVGEPVYDEDDKVTLIKRTATLHGPLTPVLSQGGQVRDGKGGLDWSIESTELGNKQVCLLWRHEVLATGPDRGGQA